MRWISVDVETFGLDDNVHKLLEFGAVSREGVSVEFLVWHEEFQTSLKVLKMHQEVLTALADVVWGSENETITTIELGTGPIMVVKESEVGRAVYKYLGLAGYGEGQWNFAAKNPQFDFGFIGKLVKLRARRRFIDPAILYTLTEDEFLPDLQTCMERAGIKGVVQHRALDDAKVVRELLLRKGW